MNWQDLATALFGTTDGLAVDGALLHGTVDFDGAPLAVVGTVDHAPIGVALALQQARRVLDVVATHPGRPLLLLVDTQGQQLRRHDELLGINRAMAHLAGCVDLARRQGHRVIALVYDQALSGGFLSTGLMADACYAVPDAQIRVMRLPAMARVTKIAEERLQALSQSNPVFAPGVDNYVAMGGVQGLWRGDLAAALREALAAAPHRDERAELGQARGGRRMAADVIARVLAAQ
jgi:malonate decarboxylase gamma subunit